MKLPLKYKKVKKPQKQLYCINKFATETILPLLTALRVSKNMWLISIQGLQIIAKTVHINFIFFERGLRIYTSVGILFEKKFMVDAKKERLQGLQRIKYRMRWLVYFANDTFKESHVSNLVSGRVNSVTEISKFSF